MMSMFASAAAQAAGRAFELEVQPGQQTILAYADVMAMAGLDERALEVAEGLEEKIYRDLVHGRVLLNQHKPEEALERFDAITSQHPYPLGLSSNLRPHTLRDQFLNGLKTHFRRC